MDYAEEWTARAVSDLRAALDYVETNNPFAIERAMRKIFKTISLIRTSPRLGSIFRRRPRPEVRSMIAGSFRIFYSPIDDLQTIQIKAIQHVKWADPDLSE